MKKPSVVFVAVSAVVGICIWLVLHNFFDDTIALKSPEQALENTPGQGAEATRSVVNPLPQPIEPAIVDRLTPSQVIGNSDCNFEAGFGNAAGTGIVIVPNHEGARFEVLDGSGYVFGDNLPFVPNHFRLGKHENGSVLAGVADLRLNELAPREDRVAEPVRIYLDGALIFESQHALDFGVATDGSAFFVIEYTAGETSQLLIRNVDKGATIQHDLAYEYTPRLNDFPFGATFTSNNEELMMVPGDMIGGKSHYFYPSDGGPRRTITLEGGGDVVFESSRFGYFAFGQGVDRPFLIKKKEFHWDNSGHGVGSVDVWSREIELNLGRMELSSDASWLVLNAWVVHALDTATGEVVFQFPVATPYADEQFARLSTVLDPAATVKDIGGVGSVQVVDGQLLMSRRVFDRTVPRKRKHFVDVFDMSSIQLDSKPVLRVELSREYGCLAGDFFMRGLQVVDGQLRYLAQNGGDTNLN
ncbi:MAG: hypothetical protein OXG25_01245 [Gammaproteobacteria bacterium]|nr:hypothetical protein [Gammaproteobacteria bacterium]